MNWFCGGKFFEKGPLERTLGRLYLDFLILKNSYLSWSSLRGFCPENMWISWFSGHVQNQKYAFLEIWTFSQKWFLRPNHYAHETRSEILCRTPVSILLYLSPRPQNLRKTSYYNFLAWMSTWISKRRRRRRRFPKNSGHLAEPCSNVPRNQISRSGNPSLRFSHICKAITKKHLRRGWKWGRDFLSGVWARHSSCILFQLFLFSDFVHQPGVNTTPENTNGLQVWKSWI